MKKQFEILLQNWNQTFLTPENHYLFWIFIRWKFEKDHLTEKNEKNNLNFSHKKNPQCLFLWSVKILPKCFSVGGISDLLFR